MGRRPHRASGHVFVVGLAVAASAGACSAADDPADPSTSSTTGAGAGGGNTTSTNTGGSVPSGLYISPVDPILKVELPFANATLAFSCLRDGAPADAAKWSLGAPGLGTISDQGGFTADGEHTGQVGVRCESEGFSAETTLRVVIHAIDDLGVSQGDKDILKGPPGASDPGWVFVYPYDKTVFPRGIPAPEIHVSGGSANASAYYVQINVENVTYEGFFPGGNGQLAMSTAAWKALGSAAAGQTVEVHVSKVAGGQKYGPLKRTWKIARGKLHGTIYYNTYSSPMAGSDAAMMRIKGDAALPEVLAGACTACHSVSADGSAAAAANFGSGIGGVFDLSGGNVNPPLTWVEPNMTAFAGLFPKDGDVLVINCGEWGGANPSELRTKTGMQILNSGIEPYCAQTPMFAHDGAMLAFQDLPSGDEATDRWPIAKLDYDAAARKFTNYEVLAMPPSGRFFKWPAFTPDGAWVVFEDGTLPTGTYGASRLTAVNVETKQVMSLATLNGTGYLPAGARDEEKNYEPTVAPIASGGYYWVVFTSRRTYGTKLVGDETQTKRLWVSAWDPSASDGVDPTSPPFYLGGQELTAPNSRGFWALDPCKADGQGCVSGDECCNGFCNATGDPPTFVCGPSDGSCSEEFESCETSADCCAGNDLECINGGCSLVVPN